MTMNDDFIKFLVARLLDNAQDAASEKSEDDFVKGKKLAYYEMLDTIKNELEVRDFDIKELGLDMTLEDLLQ